MREGGKEEEDGGKWETGGRGNVLNNKPYQRILFSKSEQKQFLNGRGKEEGKGEREVNNKVKE